MMDLKDYIFSSVMVVSAFVLTHTWLTRFGPSNSVIVVSAMLMVGALAAMILSIEMRLRRMEQDIEKKHASMKFAVESVEESLSAQIVKMVEKTNQVVDDMSRRVYK
ncbi:MAG: hypothetical protein ACXQT3_01150 [Methermicoccaceae archaeon]